MLRQTKRQLFTWLLLVCFSFLTVAGQGLHALIDCGCDHRAFVSAPSGCGFLGEHDGHDTDSLVVPSDQGPRHDEDTCAICAFCQALQQTTVAAPVVIDVAEPPCESVVVTSIRLGFFERDTVSARGPPSFSFC